MPISSSVPGPYTRNLLEELHDTGYETFLAAMEGAYPEVSSAFYEEFQPSSTNPNLSVIFTSSLWNTRAIADSNFIRARVEHTFKLAAAVVCSVEALRIPHAKTPDQYIVDGKLVPVPSYFYHSVGLIVRPPSQTIIYHDPRGDLPPETLQKAISDVFQGYEVRYVRTTQQQVEGNSGLITLQNLAAYAAEKTPDPDIHQHLWGMRRQDAPGQLKNYLRGATDNMPADPGGVDDHGVEDGIQRDHMGNAKSGQQHLFQMKDRCWRTIEAINTLDTRDTVVNPAIRLAIANKKDLDLS